MTTADRIRLPSPFRLQTLTRYPELATQDEVQAMAGWIHQQLEARARSTDPDTSHDAARSIGEMTEKRQAVLDIIRAIGGGTDEDIIDAYRSSSAPMQSASGIRTRRAELVLCGLVEDSGMRRQRSSGRHAIVWKVT
jgi:hypothetical protein